MQSDQNDIKHSKEPTATNKVTEIVKYERMEKTHHAEKLLSTYPFRKPYKFNQVLERHRSSSKCLAYKVKKLSRW